MRTTIDMTDDHRARLLELAARRKLKGFSELVAEALDAYLDGQTDREARLERALRVQGSLTAAEAEDWRANIAQVRALWRAPAELEGEERSQP